MELKAYIGHIRNHKELCEILGIEKSLPRNEREKAILLAAYKEWGGEMANHIYGMFSFVIENDDGSLFLCRDQFGTKPLYYCEMGDRLLYSQNIRDILAAEGFKKSLNQKLLQIYLTMTYTTGEETFFEGIYKLLPGR